MSADLGASPLDAGNGFQHLPVTLDTMTNAAASRWNDTTIPPPGWRLETSSNVRKPTRSRVLDALCAGRDPAIVVVNLVCVGGATAMLWLCACAFWILEPLL